MMAEIGVSNSDERVGGAREQRLGSRARRSDSSGLLIVTWVLVLAPLVWGFYEAVRIAAPLLEVVSGRS